MTLLSLKDVTKAYGGVPALKGVDLAIEPGQIHALMGHMQWATWHVLRHLRGSRQAIQQVRS